MSQVAELVVATMFEGQTTEGAMLSITVTVNEQVVEFPAVSVAMKELVVMPTANARPLAKPAVWLSEAMPQLSEPVGVV